MNENMVSTVLVSGHNYGGDKFQGTVEVFYNNRWGTVWGTVCDNGWTNSEARVVCSMLGYNRDSAVAVRLNGFNTTYPKDFLLEDVRCRGTEENLLNCSHTPYGAHGCRSQKLAGVICLQDRHGKYVRLSNSGQNYQGTVELLFNNRWHTFGVDLWSDKAAQVICYMLGYVRTGAFDFHDRALSSTHLKEDWLNGLKCSGNEPSFFHCPYVKTLSLYARSSEKVAGVRCRPENERTRQRIDQIRVRKSNRVTGNGTTKFNV
ncbi:Deleted in malignant brain tumors 1 protein [Bulinus truncatus]|nr:Deleted in malignant brain tumors 1 protein [Bulinus truncatus]